MKSMANVMLKLLILAVQRCCSPAPLSLIQRHLSTIYYFGAAMPPKLIPWCNSRINDTIQLRLMCSEGAVTLTAIARENMDCLSWLLDYVEQSIKYDILTLQETSGNKPVLFYAINPDSRLCERTCRFI